MSQVVLPPHLWRALEVMGHDMGVAPASLVNQAVFAWLRINGYVLPGTVAPLAEPAPAPAAVVSAPPVSARPTLLPQPLALVVAPVEPKPVEAPAEEADAPPSVAQHGDAPTAAAQQFEDPTAAGFRSALPLPIEPPEPEPKPSRPPLAAAVARLEEIDASLAKFTRPQPAWANPPDEAPAEDEPVDEPEEQDEVEPAREVERVVSVESTMPSLNNEPEPEAEPTVFLKASPMVLFIEREGQEPIRVPSQRFVIGRGPQCDLIIDSPRVSREHVALTRQGATFLLEDLGSSNGTWLKDERISVRELESGDEVLLGNELVTFVIRAEG